MTFTDFVILAIVFSIIGLIIFFRVKGNKSKNKCHGCPYLKTCEKNTCQKVK